MDYRVQVIENDAERLDLPYEAVEAAIAALPPVCPTCKGRGGYKLGCHDVLCRQCDGSGNYVPLADPAGLDCADDIITIQLSRRDAAELFGILSDRASNTYGRLDELRTDPTADSYSARHEELLTESYETEKRLKALVLDALR